MTIAQQLADLALSRARGTLPDHVTHAARRCIIDWTCTAYAGSNQKQAIALERGLADELGFGPSKTLSGKRATMRSAALINALASHIVEFDDIYAPGTYHPGSPTVAAALSAATGLNRSGVDLIRAVVAGYEVSNRIARALGTDHYRHWHTTGTVGTIGAAAAVATLYQLNRGQLSHALATATTMAAGLQNAFRGESEIKPLHAGHAADAGFIAVALARNDVVAAADMFEGNTGMGAAMAGEVDWQTAIGDVDEHTITRMTIKNHGCCGHIFPPLDAALALRAEHGFDPHDIVAIRVGGYSATKNVTGNYLADTPAAAKFSLPFIVASGLVYGSIRLDAYSPERLTDPTVRQLMKKISVSLDPAIDAVFPAQRAANIAIVLADGTELQRHQPHRVGDPELPLSDQQLSDKFLELTGTVLQKDDSTQLLQALWSLDSRSDTRFIYRRLSIA